MNILKDILLPALTGKKTVAQFDSHGFHVRFVLMRGVNDPRELDKEHLDAAIKEATEKVLIELLTKLAEKKAANRI